MDTDFTTALGIALKALAATDKFTAEIYALLQRKGIAAETANEVLEHLRRRNLLNDKRCVQAFLEKSIGKKTLGKESLKEKLLARGAPEGLVQEILDQDPADPLERMRELIKLHFPSGARVEKVGRYLFGKGFEEEEIETFLAAYDDSLGR